MENELKLALTEKEYKKLFAFSMTEGILQTNHYFDTMPNIDEMVRIRMKGKDYVLTYKKRNSVENNVFNAVELNAFVKKPFIEWSLVNGLSKDFLNNKFQTNFQHTLKYLGYGETYRVKFDYFGFMIELDKNIVDGNVDFELEFEDDDNENIAKLTELLAKQKIEIKQSMTKFERFLKAKGIL